MFLKDYRETKPLVVVCGPTASGKTDLAVFLAETFGGEVISADSCQIYRYMNIGTAKPDKDERKNIPHHMIDIVNPDEDFSVFDFVKMAKEYIKGCHSRGVLPIVAGGTGLYIDHLIYNIELLEDSGNEIVRKKLNDRLMSEGIEELYRELVSIDKKAAEKIHINNTKRVLRALEIYYSTGKTMSEQNELSRKNDSPYNTIVLMPVWEREKLYERINMRVDIMMKDGLEDEVKNLSDMGHGRSLKSMQAIGYKEMYKYLDGETDLESAVEEIKQNSRRYAKRQLTWFKRNKDIHLLNKDFSDEAKKIVFEFLNDSV